MSGTTDRRAVLAGLAAFAAGQAPLRAAAHSAADHVHGGPISAPAEAIDLSPASRTLARHAPPHAALVDHRGRPFDAGRELARPGPVALNFIFTTCPGVCPMLSAIMAALADELGPDLAQARLWSVTLDPDTDTPDVLADYASLWDAPPAWRFLTGEPGAVNALRAGFGVLDDNKMAHRALTLVRLDGNLWAHHEGPVTPETLAAEIRAAIAEG